MGLFLLYSGLFFFFKFVLKIRKACLIQGIETIFMAIIQIISKPFFIVIVGCDGYISFGKERTEACNCAFGYFSI